MKKYIIRLDDACPEMNKEKWKRIEQILDKYQIQPIVGIIPENQDKDFGDLKDSCFWEKCKLWNNKRWTIAMHGLHHKLESHIPKEYFQHSHSLKTEWAGKNYEQQKEMMKNGINILKKHGIVPTCFFAPCHTFDLNTVKVIKNLNKNGINIFISDGYALKPYYKKGVQFLPSIFDTPHNMLLNGVYTFVYHPNNMTHDDFKKLDMFLDVHKEKFANADEIIRQYSFKKRKKQGIIGLFIEILIYFMRGWRNIKCLI